MIKVLFPPGCYGTFLSKCIYELTDLSGKHSYLGAEVDFSFGAAGDSHDFRKNTNAKKFILAGHSHILHQNYSDLIVSVLPCGEHFLDYYDNQLYKKERNQIVSYIKTMFSAAEIQQKLSDGWKYNDELQVDAPTWILREWCSFWLRDCLAASYDLELWSDLPAKVYVDTQELFSNLYDILKNITQKLDLNLIATSSQIELLQQEFIKAQRFHGIQNRCDAWVNRLLKGYDDPTPCLTIFDEAWTQHRLRCHGYEIQCDGLNQFPRNSTELSKIIYKNA